MMEDKEKINERQTRKLARMKKIERKLGASRFDLDFRVRGNLRIYTCYSTWSRAL
jgi:hypothetical protein